MNVNRTLAVLCFIGLSILSARMIGHGRRCSTEVGASRRIIASVGSTDPRPVNATRVQSGVPGSRARFSEAFANVPLSFVPNAGQAGDPVKFSSRGRGYGLFLTDDQAIFLLRKGDTAVPSRQMGKNKRTPTPDPGQPRSAALRVSLLGANANAAVEGVDPLRAKMNYLVGNDPRKWRTNVLTYAKVKYSGIYPGVDLVYYGNQRQLEYDFIVDRFHDPRNIRFAISGTSHLTLTRERDLLLCTPAGDLRMQKPFAYQEIRGVRYPVEANFAISRGNEVGFVVADYNRSIPLVIDPVLRYSSFIGTNAYDEARGVAVDDSGNAYVVGSTGGQSIFPPSGPTSTFTAGSFAGEDVFVAKFDTNATVPANSLVYTTIIGGSADEEANGIALDLVGNIYITGLTASSDFPTAGAVPPYSSGIGSNTGDAFLTKLNPSGTSLLYSTYLGGSGVDHAFAIAVDSAGSAYIAGQTYSSDFPTVHAVESTCPTSSTAYCAFASKFDTTGGHSGAASLLYSTYLGPTGSTANDTIALGIAVDDNGQAYVTGSTSAPDFPVSVATYGSYPCSGTYQAFVAEVTTSAFSTYLPLYSRCLGGSVFDEGHSIAIDAAGNVYVAGQTYSSDFPITNDAIQTTNAGGGDAFITKLRPVGILFEVTYSTFFGGSSYGLDVVNTLTLHNSKIYVGGVTNSEIIPSPSVFFDGSVNNNPIQSSCGTNSVCDQGKWDGFIAEVDPSIPGGAGLLFFTYLGGNDYDQIYGIAVDSQGSIYVAGQTASTLGFPVRPSNAYQAMNAGGTDAFLTRIDDPQTDLVLAISASSNTVLAGGALTYTITVTNGGPADVSNVAVNYDLFTPLTFVSCAATNGGVCGLNPLFTNAAYRQVVFPSLPALSSATATVQTSVNSNAAGGTAAEITATALSGNTDPNPSNNTASLNTTVENRADLFVTNTASSTSVKASSSLTYTIKVQNLGPDPATAVLLADAVPANSTFVSLNGATCTVPAIGTVGTVSCNLGNMASDASATVNLTVKISGSLNKGSVTDTATASTTSYDPNLANNSATVNTSIYSNKK